MINYCQTACSRQRDSEATANARWAMSVLVLGTVNRVLQTISRLALADCTMLVRV